MNRALVIGYGSIGQRHARILANLGLSTAVVSRRQVDAETVFSGIAEGVEEFKPDYVIVASRTNEHAGDIETLAATGFSGVVLVEKPLFMTMGSMPANQFARCHVAYNLRFHPLMQALRRHLGGRAVYAAHCHAGSSLPTWRPGTDYRTGYSAIKDQGGGVIRDLSHELDYVLWLLGGWKKVTH